MRRVAPVLPEFGMGNVIPRLLHQHFLAGEDAIPAEIRTVSASLRSLNPDWEYTFWDASRAETFIRETYGDAVLARYLRINPEYYAARSDLLRYLSMYALGGVYLDIKSTCKIPLTTAVQSGEKFLLFSSGRFDLLNTPHVPEGEYQQWVIVSVPGHPFLKAAIERVLDNIDAYASWRDGVGAPGTLRVTGPIAYTHAIHPIRAAHTFSDVGHWWNRGFFYSGLQHDGGHITAYTRSAHYSLLQTPITSVSSLDTVTRKSLEYINSLPGAGLVRRVLRKVGRGFRKLIAFRPT